MMANFKSTKINPSRFSWSQGRFLWYLIPLCVFMALPIVFILANAFKPMDELFAYPPRFFVANPTLQNFTMLFKQSSVSGIPFTRYLFNSILMTTIGVTLTVILTAMTGYGLSKMHFKSKKILFKINQTALMFVPIAVTIPRFLTIVNMGLYNSFWVQILPLLAMPVGLFLVKQFIDQVPDELIEAAKIDGAGDLQIFWNIIIPIIKPALATVAILSFQEFWNSETASALYIDSESKKTLAFFLSSISAGNSVAGKGMEAAATFLMFVPSLIIFIIIQNNVMDTMSHSGIK
jgi:ABC-type glycerol-3-phosphate transport system permease component